MPSVLKLSHFPYIFISMFVQHEQKQCKWKMVVFIFGKVTLYPFRCKSNKKILTNARNRRPLHLHIHKSQFQICRYYNTTHALIIMLALPCLPDVRIYFELFFPFLFWCKVVAGKTHYSFWEMFYFFVCGFSMIRRKSKLVAGALKLTSQTFQLILHLIECFCDVCVCYDSVVCRCVCQWCKQVK